MSDYKRPPQCNYTRIASPERIQHCRLPPGHTGEHVTFDGVSVGMWLHVVDVYHASEWQGPAEKETV